VAECQCAGVEPSHFPGCRLATPFAHCHGSQRASVVTGLVAGRAAAHAAGERTGAAELLAAGELTSRGAAQLLAQAAHAGAGVVVVGAAAAPWRGGSMNLLVKRPVLGVKSTGVKNLGSRVKSLVPALKTLGIVTVGLLVSVALSILTALHGPFTLMGDLTAALLLAIPTWVLVIYALFVGASPRVWVGLLAVGLGAALAAFSHLTT